MDYESLCIVYFEKLKSKLHREKLGNLKFFFLSAFIFFLYFLELTVWMFWGMHFSRFKRISIQSFWQLCAVYFHISDRKNFKIIPWHLSEFHAYELRCSVYVDYASISFPQRVEDISFC